MLSALQRQILRLIADLPEAQGFVLAGGAALVLRGDIDRATRDLDLFTTAASDVALIVDPLEARLSEAGLAVERVRVTDTFVRLLVADEADQTEIDLARDSRLLPTEQTELWPTLAPEELAIDKVLALFDRAEARDFADLADVVDRWGLEHLCNRAKEKDEGFDLQIFIEQLARFDRLPVREFQLPPDSISALRQTVAEWRQALSETD